ncbi:GLPGLI family protein [Frigoriflavimonas asaccharolytica]|uniref:GLPGLI family protein n=1 Tax=Frigoriflavimonas asaccharolytica TaxID=2735899 RepID=A0A8J8G8A5_9FLAO|nr:GLPGLI family protein [Frigoriflavimonas asaccharolytica]NRS91105.1 GLPGLI family protein [Frigoriflavimonas asaccharolytica]
MKKLTLLFLAIAFQLSFAQTNRFIYQVTMKPDANDKASEFTEKAYLDISPTKSMFYGEKRMLRDSLISRNIKTGNWDRSQFEDLRSKIDFLVIKDLGTQKTSIQQRIARDNFEYEEDRKMVWKILPETTKIGEYKVQKAETEFAGRTWIAYFAQELPYQDGPYKFSGLPGLIVKVEDADGDYSFDLQETKKIAQMAEFQTFGSTVKLKRTDFKKQLAKYEKDPIATIQSQSQGQGFGGGRGRGNGGGGGGNRTQDPQRQKETEKRMKDEIAKNNNPIEKE